MSVITSMLLLSKKGILLTFLTLFSFFIFETVCSQKRWHRDYVSVSYNKLKHSITINFEFMDYEFGLFGEHGYFESCDFEFNVNGVRYIKLMRCEVEDQVNNGTAWMFLKEKLAIANIQFIGSHIPESGSFWQGDSNQRIEVKNILTQGSFTVIWYMPPEIKNTDILISGKWRTTGLKCSYVIVSEVYSVLGMQTSEYDVKCNLKQKQEYASSPDQNDIKPVKVFSDLDAIVVNGLERGDKIDVYTISGARIGATIANNDVVRIKLPVNQIYIVTIRQHRYKVAL